MEVNDSISRDNALCEFILRMAVPTIDIEAEHDSLIEELEKIYINGKDDGAHRHSYARLSHVFYDQDIDVEGLNVCIEKLSELEKYIEEEKKAALLKSFRKLKDHVELETIHIGQLRRIQLSVDYSKDIVMQFPEISAKIDRSQKEIDDAKERIDQCSESAKKLEDEIKGQTVQSVTILGIFAGVVFAFSGGFSVLTSTLSNIHVISGKETLFFFSSALGIGCILYDVVFALMLFIGRYCDKEPKNIMEFTKTLNASIFIMICILMSIYCLCYNGDIRLIPCGTG